MKVKAVFMDLDGTTLKEDLTISDELKNKISELQNKGIKFFVSTGRSYKSSKRYVEELGLHDETITYNGARIVPTNTEINDIYEQPLSVDIVSKIIDISKETGIHLNLYYNDDLYVQSANDKAEMYANSVGINYIVENFENFRGKTSTKGLFIAEHEILLDLKHRLETELPDVNYVFSRPYYLEVLNKNVNKGKAVEYIINKHNIKVEETMAFGDQWNDLEMLEFVKYGILMGNAPLDLKNKFSNENITLSNDEDGILYMLNKIEI